LGIEAIVVAMLVLPPVLVGVVGWCAGRLSARDERRHDLGIGKQRVGYAKLGSAPDQPIAEDRRAA
jgi:hypothetical protein